MAFRKTLYASLEPMQADLDVYVEAYNMKRTNQGKRCLGRTPKQTWDDVAIFIKNMWSTKRRMTRGLTLKVFSVKKHFQQKHFPGWVRKDKVI